LNVSKTAAYVVSKDSFNAKVLHHKTIAFCIE